MCFLRLRRPWGFSHEARGPQGASRAVPGNSCLHAHGEGELVITLESWDFPGKSTGVECHCLLRYWRLPSLQIHMKSKPVKPGGLWKRQMQNNYVANTSSSQSACRSIHIRCFHNENDTAYQKIINHLQKSA